MTYPLEFRKAIFATKTKKKLTYQQTSDLFSIPMRTLLRWSKRIEPCTTRNKPATKINMQALRDDVAQYPDDYQRERAKRFGVTSTGIRHALKRLGISYKKNTKTPKSK